MSIGTTAVELEKFRQNINTYEASTNPADAQNLFTDGLGAAASTLVIVANAIANNPASGPLLVASATAAGTSAINLLAHIANGDASIKNYVEFAGATATLATGIVALGATAVPLPQIKALALALDVLAIVLNNPGVQEFLVTAVEDIGALFSDATNRRMDEFVRELDSTLSKTFDEFLTGLGKDIDAISSAISNTIGTTPDPLVKTIHYVQYSDPLVLDLNGDGLQITPLSQAVLFDADGDATKNATAWVGADDGMLVWDRNGDGTINSGAELFGDETVLANGQKADNGFAALSELDVGSVVDGVTVGAGDGVFDAKDAQYANLRVWRDLNQDGISQSDELKTLAESGVQSITLGSMATSTNYGDAILVQNGTFTRTDGSSGQAGNFILAQNFFVREVAPITISDAAKELPVLKGTGWVRDLQEAATLDPELIALLNQVKAAPTRAEFKNTVANLIRTWGNDSDYNSASKQPLCRRSLQNHTRAYVRIAVAA